MEMNRKAGREGGGVTPEATKVEEYYVKLGLGHDHLLRCKDCHQLVVHQHLMTAGGCSNCGCRRMVQISTLKFWEWFKIRIGWIDFPHRKLFLKEFARAKS